MRSVFYKLLLSAGGMLVSTNFGHAADSHQRVGARTSQPIGHYEYCLSHIADCSIRAYSTLPVKLTREKWTQMQEANTLANSTIKPVTDMELYGVEELWTLPKTSGDCEDYVLLKRKYLLDRGWPASALLATVVLQPSGDGHAVLTVRTDRGDFILDNLEDTILSWELTDYKFLKRQSAAFSGYWEDILDTRMSVASIKRAN